MRRRIPIILILILALFPNSAWGLLQDSDPKNFFILLETAEIVARVSVKDSQHPKPGQRFQLYRLKIHELLKGPRDLNALGVLDEPLTPGATPLLPGEAEFLLFLAKSPGFTAYQEVLRQGYEYRVLGGKSGVFLDPEAGLALAKAYLGADPAQRNAVLFQALASKDLRVANDAALKLGERPKIFLNAESIATLVGAVRERPLQDPTKIALVRVLEKSGGDGALDALRQVADDPPSAAKWAAIRVLEKLGAPRPLDRLAEDFRRSNEAEKNEVLALIVPQKNPAAENFLSGLLAGPTSLEIKKSALHQMGAQKFVGYEALMLDQISKGEAALKAEAILALGRMGSAKAVPLVVPLLDSREPKLRAAAFLMLSESPDPRAQEIINRRFTRDHHGVWEQNQHFYGPSGTGQNR